MSEFDPYHRWLGIAPGTRPPNHYVLLGIPVFEDDLEVIASAADRQMSHVRSFQSGAHASHSQQLLNELAAARVCLLQSDRKQAYDEQLRATLSQPSARSGSKVRPPSQETTPTPEPSFPVFSANRPTSARTTSKKRSTLAGWVAGGMLLVMVGISVVLWQVISATTPRGTLVVRVTALDMSSVTLEVDGRNQKLDDQGECQVEVAAGPHAIRANAPAHVEFHEQATVAAGKSQVVRVALRPIARVTITCPEDRVDQLTLTFNNKSLEIPANRSLVLACEAGEHSVRASQGEWQFERTVAVTAGQNRLVALPGRNEQRLQGRWQGRVELDADALAAKLKDLDTNPLQKILFQGLSASLQTGQIEIQFRERNEFSVDLQLGPLSTKATGTWRVVESSAMGVIVELQPQTGPSDTRRLLFVDDNTFTTELPGEARTLGRFRCTRNSAPVSE